MRLPCVYGPTTWWEGAHLQQLLLCGTCVGRLTFSLPRTLKEMPFSTGSSSGRYRTTRRSTSMPPCKLTVAEGQRSQMRSRTRSMAACSRPPSPPRWPRGAALQRTQLPLACAPAHPPLTACGQPGSGRRPSITDGASGS